MLHQLSTRLLYLTDPALRRHRATVTEVIPARNGEGAALVLDQSGFYPQGGGQPSDRGTVEGPRGSLVVSDVRIVDGVVRHAGHGLPEHFTPGDSVDVVIDDGLRHLHSRIHSAGELLCAVLPRIYGGEWPVVGAIHFCDRSSVEFGRSPDRDLVELDARIEDVMNSCVIEGGPVRVETVNTLAEAQERCGFTPEYLDIGEPIRIVTVLPPWGRPCLGTHVSDLSEIGTISVRKLKTRKGRMKVSYEVE